MSDSQSFSTRALIALLDWVEARLAVLPAGTAFAATLPRPPYQYHAAAPRSADLPVLRFWPAALPDDADLATGAAGRALRALTPVLRWRQNPNYRDPDFLAGYGYAEIAGPAGIIAAPGLSLGVLLLGPAMLYPAHRHPAEEIYLPLRPAFWQHGDAGPWLPQSSGAVIHHPSMLPHAMRTDTAALAALYLWRGDLGTPARLDPPV